MYMYLILLGGNQWMRNVRQMNDEDNAVIW